MEQSDVEARVTEYPDARLWRRLAALLYDAFLVAAIWMLLGFIVLFIYGVDSNQVVDGQVYTDPQRDVLLFTLMLVGCCGFYCYFWMRSGQTPGMIAWRLKVITHDGNLLSLPVALKRFVLAWPAMLLVGVGYLWIYLDAEGRALHDRLSGTRVVLVPRTHRPF